MTFDEAAREFAKARNKSQGRPLCGRGNNTRLHRVDDDGTPAYAVRYHATNVVVIEEGDIYTLNTGGWQTVTTKERINAFGPVRIWQEQFVWYVQPANRDHRIPFEDGMRFDAAGNLLDGQSDPLAQLDDAMALAGGS